MGAFTALIGASSALLQRDIKKVLAYSTVSQLGYMFLGLSAGAWSAALFHLVTHAFFKGLLFLGSGSVIHGMHEEQDMYRMGGLRKAMPRTFLTFLAGSAALSGLPLLSGFFSKDEILARNFALGGFHYLLWGVGIATAALTAFYTWRMVALTFFGQPRYDEEKLHPHESPAVMTLPARDPRRALRRWRPPEPPPRPAGCRPARALARTGDAAREPAALELHRR